MTDLNGQLVRLREFTEHDLSAAHAIDGDPRVTDWLSFDARTIEGSKHALQGIIDRRQQEPRTEFYLAVSLLDEDQVVGFARLGLTGVRAAKLGFAIHADFWGRGYATDAARTLVNHGFGDVGLHRITAAIGPENQASIAVITKLGFKHEGRLRDHVYTNGGWRDSLLYSVLASDRSGE